MHCKAAAEGGHAQVVRMLLKHKADVNAQGVIMAMHCRQLPKGGHGTGCADAAGAQS